MKISLLTKCYLVVLLIGLESCKKDQLPAELAQWEDKLPEKIDYNEHIKPILSDRCFKCHGPDKNKIEAGLQLANFDGATASLKSGKTAIIPGNINRSELVERILSHDPETIMPTPKSNLKLTDEEKALLVRWIQQGAEYKEHWAFVAIEKPAIPSVQQTSWVQNPIDNFILEKLESKKIKPSPQADKATLLRRVSMDMTGLPPTVKELDDFLRDKSPNAYEKVVDRLLNSPHYGERQAVDWLDLARYADSHGYQDDGMRNVFPWRDWVIKSFNQNLPYDKFVTWQLAGDLLPHATTETQMATCFLRNHPQTQEGGVVDEEYRTEYVLDRVNTLGKAFLGLTVECARCHDHKYDPIAQKEFYQLSAFFNSNNESGIIPYNGEASPTITLATKATKAKLRYILTKIAPLQKAIVPQQPIYQKNFENWIQVAIKTPQQFAQSNKGLIADFSFEGNTLRPNKRFDKKLNKEITEMLPLGYKNAAIDTVDAWIAGDMDRKPSFVKGKKGRGLRFMGDCGIDFHKSLDFEQVQPFSVSLWINPLKVGEKGPIFNSTNGEFEGHRGYRCWLLPDGTLQVSLSYVWPANCIDIVTTQKVKYRQWQNITLVYDGLGKAKGVKIYLDGKEMPRQVLTDNLSKSILYGENKSHWDRWTDMPFMMGKEFRETLQNLAIDELKVYKRQLSAIEIQDLVYQKNAILSILQTPRNCWTASQTQDLFTYYLLNFDPIYDKNTRELSYWRDQFVQVNTDRKEVMVMSERKIPRKTYILNRGVYDALGEEVSWGTINKILPFSDDYPKNRLGLAQWLLDKKNPLFARVAINRIWQNYFGFGICKTSDDFGNQGEMPSHPALLDWLATAFRDSGWDVKAMHKLIVMSATYQQSSTQRADLQEIDAENRLLARGPSYRYAHEQIRDAILASSGLLVRKIGGPSVYPYQPAGIWEALATRNVTSYKIQHGDSLYRRGMYTIWKRSSPPPSAITFDSPERYFCVIKRQKTSTPLQALVLMNDPQYNEAARKLAERMLKEGGATIQDRITFAFKAMVSRYPSAKEVQILTQLYQDEKKDIETHPSRAKELLNVGESPIDQQLNPVELAANTVIGMTLINFDGTIIKR
ncbi:DUF1553 domain-containing protein [Flectobacillus major]|uniref:DUF1553 domain-containing protein n=1 Tax=Flectobacillus major TaxID=103 RepID=UPI0005C63518|nr:DUF1553 domain-containing protein [Flectobacillus major]